MQTYKKTVLELNNDEIKTLDSIKMGLRNMRKDICDKMDCRHECHNCPMTKIIASLNRAEDAIERVTMLLPDEMRGGR